MNLQLVNINYYATLFIFDMITILFILLLLILLTFQVVLELQGGGCLPSPPPTTTRVIFQFSSFPTWTRPQEVHAYNPPAVGSAFI